MNTRFELHGIEKAQAEIDSKQAEAVSKLLSTLHDTPDAVIQVGSVLLVKVNGVPVVRTLTLHDMIILKRNPVLLKEPANILSALQDEVQNFYSDILDALPGVSTQQLPSSQQPTTGP